MMGMSFYFILPIEYGVHDTCGRTIDGMDKFMMDMLGAIPKIINIHNELGLFSRSPCGLPSPMP